MLLAVGAAQRGRKFVKYEEERGQNLKNVSRKEPAPWDLVSDTPKMEEESQQRVGGSGKWDAISRESGGGTWSGNM